MNSNLNGQFSGSEFVKRFFTRTSMLTVTIASAILSALIIFQTVIYTVSGDKISMISSLYYLFDYQNISVINAVFGTVISLVSILFFVSFLLIYLKAKSNESVTSGFSALTFSSVMYIIVSCITLAISFASISVLRYESSKLSNMYDSREFSHAPSSYSAAQANYDFFVYILFGTAAIILGIGAVRLSLAIKKASLGTEVPSNRGGALFLIGAVMSVILTTISFFITLGELVIPDTSENLKPITLLGSTVNVLIFAAVAAFFYGICFLTSHYNDGVNRIFRPRPRVNSYYAGYATNVNRSLVTPPYNPQNQQYAQSYRQQYAPQQTQYVQQQQYVQPTENAEPTVQAENVQESEVQTVTSNTGESEE